MRTFAITTLGCKVNQYESQQIRELLQRLGLSPAGPDDHPDLVVANTCCVTHAASAKSRQQIRRNRKLHPNAVVVVAGCLPAAQTDELSDLTAQVHLVGDKSRLAEELTCVVRRIQQDADKRTKSNDIPPTINKSQRTAEIKDKSCYIPTPSSPAEAIPAASGHSTADPTGSFGFEAELAPLSSYSDQTRAFLKIQDGCDAYCSYCVIPKIRTRVYNKDVKTILDEATRLVGAGHREIVLTGIFLGAWGQNTARRRKWSNGQSEHFADLVHRVSQVPGLARLRLSSLEPGDVTEPLLRLVASSRNIVPHLHLPLQSGSPNILRRMARQYSADEYREMLARVQQHLDRPAVTTDIIVGFPGESEADFECTMTLARDAQFAKIHVFPYSDRAGTAASGMRPKTNPVQVKDRANRLQALDRQLQRRFRRQFLGEPVSVLIERPAPPFGRSERYFMVKESDLNEPVIEDGFLRGTLVR